MVVGFPKTGTTTITRALSTAGWRTAHWRINEGFVGILIQANIEAGRPAFAGLERYDAVTQADVCLPGRGLNFWPNLDLTVLDTIRRDYPDCLFILNTRDPAKTIASMRGWGRLHRRIMLAEVPGLPKGCGRSDAELERWIQAHYAAVRLRFGVDPRFVEFDIEDPAARDILAAATGLDLVWWGRANRTNLARQSTGGTQGSSGGSGSRIARKGKTSGVGPNRRPAMLRWLKRLMKRNKTVR
ncbi:sulfotransferase [Prosthecodimorpha staleyi]